MFAHGAESPAQSTCPLKSNALCLNRGHDQKTNPLVIEVIETFARALLGLVFAAALWGKFSKVGFRSLSQATAGMLPERLSGVSSGLAATALGIQLLIVLTVFTSAYRLALVLSLALLASYILGMVRVIRSRQELACSCFAGDAGPIGITEVTRNLLLFSVAAFGLVASIISPSMQPTVVSLFVPSASAIVFAVILIRASDVVAIFKPSIDRT